MIRTYYCIITMDRLAQLEENVARVLPFVDEVIVVDGGSTDGTLDWLHESSYYPNGTKLNLVKFPWCDDFAASRNAYLQKIAQMRQPGELSIYVRADDDEFLSEAMLKNLKAIVAGAQERSFNQVRIRARDIFLDREGKPVSDVYADFWKPLIHVWEPGMAYFGKVHEALYTPSGANQIDLDDQDGKLYYEHRKQDRVYWPRGLRNFFIGGGGVPPQGNKQPLWLEFKTLIAQYGDFKTYRDFEAYLAGGKIAQPIKDWFIKNRKYGWPSQDPKHTEVREGFLTYFVWYNPEELPQELFEEDSDYMNYQKEIAALHGEQAMAPDSITYVCVTSPNLDKMKRNIPLIMPFVDRAVIVIGRRDAEAEKYLKSVPNLKLVYQEWTDSFRDQYQVALNNISGGWMLWLDDDEVPSEGMLKSLRPIVAQSAGATQFDTVGFPCLNEDGSSQEYHRELLVAWNPSLRFEIHLHQALIGKRRGARAEVGYHHPKDPMGGLRGGCRNWFIGGSWADTKDTFEYLYIQTGQDPRINPGTPLCPNPSHPAYPLQDGFKTKEWAEMKDILAKHHPEAKYFGHVDALIRAGKICPEFAAWAERVSQDKDPLHGLNEAHSFLPYIQQYQVAL